MAIVLDNLDFHLSGTGGAIRPSTEFERASFSSMYGILESLAATDNGFNGHHAINRHHDYSSLESLIAWNYKNVLS